MFKPAFALIVTMSFLAVMVTSSMAASVKCKITEVAGPTVTLDCGAKSEKFQVGDSVKVRNAKRKAIEGC